MPCAANLSVPNTPSLGSPNLHVHHLTSTREDVLAEVLAGLSAVQKSLPAKFFYDAQGSQLFDAITELPEYYPTRTEAMIFERFGKQMCEALGPEPVIIEPGSGNCQKVRPLLHQSDTQAYVPIEISDSHLIGAAIELARDFPALEIHAVCADFTQTQALPQAVPQHNRTTFFPGSTIGNFEPTAALRLLQSLRGWVGSSGGLLIGVDTKKDEALLNAAYNDAQGITAAFNRNMLQHLNRLLDADFNPQRFDHQAFYNPQQGRIEMHLRSRGQQQVNIGDQHVDFADGETIHTENSYKYTPEEFQTLAALAGFRSQHCWQDSAGMFSVHYLTV